MSNTPANRVRTRVKICGIRDRDAAAVAAQAGADAVGFILVPGLPRTVEPEDAAAIMYALPPMVNSVGVVRNLSVDEFADLEQRCPCELMQLHGDEDDKTVASARVSCESTSLKEGSTQTVTITGRIVTPVGDENLKSWLVNCALEAAARK